MDYDINNVLGFSSGPHETVTDIFYRFRIIRNVVNNLSSYFVYDLQDGDTPENLAENFYGDKGAGWIILYANNIIDPQWDWPLGYEAFNKMILDRYGSLENAQTQIHHSEMVIERTNEFYGTTSTTTFVIDNIRQTQDVPEYPYAYYTPWTVTTFRTGDSGAYSADSEQRPYLTADITYDDPQTFSRSGSIPTVTGVNTVEIDGHTIVETTYGRQVSMFDWELKQNDDRKIIKIVKAEYYTQIMDEFQKMLGISPFRGV
jgi:hypothetical protein